MFEPLKRYSENIYKTYWIVHFTSVIICSIPLITRYPLDLESYLVQGFAVIIVLSISLAFTMVYLQSKLLTIKVEYPVSLDLRDYLYISVFTALVMMVLVCIDFSGSFHLLLFIPVIVCAMNYGKRVAAGVALLVGVFIMFASLVLGKKIGSSMLEDEMVHMTIMFLLAYLIGNISEENKRLAMHLKESLQFLTRLVDSIPAAIVSFSSSREIKYANRRFEEMTGISVREVLGQPLESEEVVRLPVLRNNRDFIERAIQDGESVDGIKDYVTCEDGRRIAVSAGIYALQRQQHGRKSGEALMILNDLTSEQEAAEWRRKSHHLLQEVEVGIVFVDGSGRVEMLNPAAERILGKDVQSVGIPFEELLKERSNMTEDQYQRLLSAEQADIELRMHGRVLILKKKDIRATDGIQGGKLFIINDVTELHEMNEKIRKAATLSIIGEIAAGTVHEIRNPLTTIKGMLQLMSFRDQEKKVKDLKEYFDLILDEIERLNKILSDFLLLARPGKKEFARVNLNELIEELWSFIESRGTMEKVSTEKRLAEHLPPVLGNRDQLKQVVINIVNNAFQAVYEGGRIIVRSYVDSDGQVCIDIADNGEGIPESILSRIFNPFFTTRDNGTGLGLAISNRIMNEHGGEICVKTEPSRGTTFTLKFPPCDEKTVCSSFS